MADAVFENIRLLCLDVDGVLTDGGIYLNDQGVETKRFHVRDGAGIRMWTALGFEIAIITGRTGMALRHRLNELGIEHLVQGARDKGDSLIKLMNELELAPEEVAVLVDDLPDLPMMRVAGYAMAVADAVRDVLNESDFVTVRPGGAGAVREAIEHLLKNKDAWDDALALFG